MPRYRGSAGPISWSSCSAGADQRVKLAFFANVHGTDHLPFLVDDQSRRESVESDTLPVISVADGSSSAGRSGSGRSRATWNGRSRLAEAYLHFVSFRSRRRASGSTGRGAA